MATNPFKVVNVPASNANGATQTRTIGVVPKQGDPGVNEEPTNVVPDHPPVIAWPEAKPLEQPGLPMRLKK